MAEIPLIERLRAYHPSGEHGRLHQEAADTLESLQLEVVRLREALEEIADMPGPSSYWLKGVGDIIIGAEEHCSRIARQALNPKRGRW